MHVSARDGVAGAVILAMVAMYASPLGAATAPPVTATVTANVPIRAELALIRDTGSVTRGSVSSILFDKYDDKDVPGGSAIHMYAPYRSETGKNWHVAQIIGNGTTMTLGATVTGAAGTTPLANIMDTFFGGFFRIDGSNAGGASGDWELLNGFTRTLNEPFVGSAPFNYRLRLFLVPGSSTPYTGQVTFTLTSN